ncbi:Uncharacterised protein [Burkholderia pseudomallei]|nr:Uncharacterised protein [Burkholderia pseudomallei]
MDDRLHVQAKAVVFERGLDPAAPLHVADVARLLQIARVRELDAVAPALLRDVARDVGELDGHLQIARRLAELEHADAHAHREALALPQEHEILEAAAQPLRLVLRRPRSRAVRQQHAELVAAEPREHVVVVEAALEALRDFAQHRVARRVAAGVVDLLEAVEIEHQQHRIGALLAGGRVGKRDLEPALELDAVHEPRQHVVRRLPREAFEELLLARHVAQDQHVADVPVHAVAHLRNRCLHNDLRMIAAQQMHLALDRRALLARPEFVDDVDRVPRLLVEQHQHARHRRADARGGRVAEQLLGRVVDEVDVLREPDRDHRLRDRAQRRLGERLAAIERVLDRQPLQRGLARPDEREIHQEHRRDEVADEQQRDARTEFVAERLREAIGQAGHAFVDFPRAVFERLHAGVVAMAAADERMKLARDAAELGELDVRLHPALQRIVDLRDPAERGQQQRGRGRVGRIDAARDDRLARARAIGRLALQRGARETQPIRLVDRGLIELVRALVARLRIADQVDDRVLLRLRPRALAADVDPEERHHREAHDHDAHEHRHHQQDRPDVERRPQFGRLATPVVHAERLFAHAGSPVHRPPCLSPAAAPLRRGGLVFPRRAPTPETNRRRPVAGPPPDARSVACRAVARIDRA